ERRDVHYQQWNKNAKTARGAQADAQADTEENFHRFLTYYMFAIYENPETRSKVSTFICAHQFTLGQYMLLHRLFHDFLGRARLQFEHGMESIYLKKIPMCLPRRGTWPAIAQVLEVIQTLCAAARNVLALGQVFRKFLGCGGKVIKYPMNPGP